MFGNPYQQYQPQLYQPFNAPLPTFQEVEGQESIQMLRIPPNSKHVYFDRKLDRFYTVSTDAAGAKSIEAYDFIPAKEPEQPKYLTVDEFNAWRSRYEQPIQQAPAAVEPYPTSNAAWKPAGGASQNPADAPIWADNPRPVQPGTQMG